MYNAGEQTVSPTVQGFQPDPHLLTRTRSVPLPHDASPRVPLSDRYESSETHANLDESVGWSATMSTAPRLGGDVGRSMDLGGKIHRSGWV